MMRYIALFILLFGTWLLLTFTLKWESLLVGVFVASLASGLFGRHFPRGSRKLLEPARYFWAVVYLFIFAWECVKANFDVAYRVLHPDLPIRPGIVKVKLSVKSDMARAMLANSITMTPGTITVDIIDGYIYIHWIYVSTFEPEAYSRKVCGRFEKYIRRIYE
jgi:multicomponent Na+:H+ antiporter subunit E